MRKSYLFGYHSSLALPSIRCQEYFLNGVLDEKVYMEQPPNLLLKGSQGSVQVEKVFIWIETDIESLIWIMSLLFKLLVFLVLRRINQCFGITSKEEVIPFM